MENFTGTKYQRGQDVAEIAKLIRAEIKRQTASGQLPKGLKASVTISRYSMGRSISIELTVPFAVLNQERIRRDLINRFEPGCQPIFNAEATELVRKVESLANQWNFDKSDSQTDYYNSNFCLTVDFNCQREQAERDILEGLLKRGLRVKRLKFAS